MTCFSSFFCQIMAKNEEKPIMEIYGWVIHNFPVVCKWTRWIRPMTIRVRIQSECVCNMRDVATLPDLTVLRVQLWIRTSFYSLTCSWALLRGRLCPEPSLDNFERVAKYKIHCGGLSQVLWIVKKVPTSVVYSLHCLHQCTLACSLRQDQRWWQ